MARAVGGSESRTDTSEGRLLLTAKEVRRALGVSVQNFERILKRGEIPIVKVDRLRRFRPDAVAEWIRAHETGGDQ